MVFRMYTLKGQHVEHAFFDTKPNIGIFSMQRPAPEVGSTTIRCRCVVAREHHGVTNGWVATMDTLYCRARIRRAMAIVLSLSGSNWERVTFTKLQVAPQAPLGY
jgi:hypothetical protein